MERHDCLSTILYYIVNKIIGDREAVSIRRDKYDINNASYNTSHNFLRFMNSGSKREGLNMAGSDTDVMMWYSNICVICDTTHVHYYNNATDTLILAEYGITRPGFVLLRLLHQACTLQTLLLSPSFVSLHNHTYISSSRHRQLYYQAYGSIIDIDLHGPCSSGYINGQESDFAFCFHCLHWPPQAFSWLQRCQRHRWPSPSVLQDISRSGCHFVAIGAKQSIFENVEWRLSFSQAEQKLIYSFNHSQLLVYGLLKLFLKEVLNSGIPENQKLLCSYFMKTALFWQIQADILTQWSIDNFLLCFWNCFKLLIKWVTCQYCPNFFVPENNMFFPKITGTRQQRILSQLLGLYDEGVVCLLRSASIQDKIIFAFLHSHCTFSFSYELHSSEIKKDSALCEMCMCINYKKTFTHEDHIKYIHFLVMKFRSSFTQAQRLNFYTQIIYQCQSFALSQKMTRIHGRGNIEKYTLKKQSLNLLKQTSRLGRLTDVIYLAMHYYIDGRYTRSLCVLHEIKHKLYRPYVIYSSLNPEIYIQTMGGKSLSTKLKESFTNDILIPDFANLPELRLEQRVLEKISFEQFPFPVTTLRLIVSPLVFVYFLTFLCHHHLDSTNYRQQALDNLNTLVHSNDNKYITLLTKSTAWKLLGICHQMNQNPQQALQCYRKSLTTEIHKLAVVHTATNYRIKSVERKLIQQHITGPPLDYQ